jgi:hypothetical protein
VGVSDDTMLTAIAAGYPVNDFARLNREIFLLGDAERLTEVISRVSRRSSKAPDQLQLARASPSHDLGSAPQLLRC